MDSKPEPSASRGTILVVDDAMFIRRLSVRLLASLGFDTLEAGTGQEALAQCAQHGDDLVLCMTDISMPGMDGRELGERIRGLGRGIKLLFVSGHDCGSASGSADASGVGYLQKPFTKEELQRGVDALLAAPPDGEGPAG